VAEALRPAGHWEACVCAAEGGARAVVLNLFGLEGFHIAEVCVRLRACVCALTALTGTPSPHTLPHILAPFPSLPPPSRPSQRPW
jgi:hypothetical protein